MKNYKAVFRIACKLMSLSFFLAFAIFHAHDEIDDQAAHCPGKDIIVLSHVHSNIQHKIKKLKLESKIFSINFPKLFNYKTALLSSPIIVSSLPLVNLTSPTILRL